MIIDDYILKQKHGLVSYDTSAVNCILILKNVKMWVKISILELMKYSITRVTLLLTPCHRETGFLFSDLLDFMGTPILPIH